MYKRFILTEEDKNEIVSLYSKKNIVLEQAATEKPITVQDIQLKLVDMGCGDMLGKYQADGKFGKMTYSAITQAINDIEQRKQSRQNAGTMEPMKTRDVTQLPTTDKGITIPTVSALAQANQDIKTTEQAQAAIDAAREEAKRLSQEERQARREGRQAARKTKEMCRPIGRAVNPINPFRKEVATEELCEALRECISDGLLVRDETVFTACNAFPSKSTTTSTGTTQTTNTTKV